jgi:hypothetical protein
MAGNAAAALQGAPVTTVDIDFLFRKTPANLKKLKALAASLGAMLLKPFFPGFGVVYFGGHSLHVADLADIIKSKRAAAKPPDRAALPVLQTDSPSEKKDIKKGKASGAEARK